ncbi:MAG: FAD-dependent oxidoreductase [Calditrichaeota bacterium]|nr:FAD-dependent oxidoreductase [Calditrichota bacterium]
MSILKTRLLDRKPLAENTVEFILEKPAGMDFIAGQNVNIKLAELFYEDKKGPRRPFTIASSPQESELIIATRMTGSGFKKTFAEMPLGSEIECVGPNGKFYLDDDSTDIVFIAGGIGITPFRSMILDAVATKKSVPMVLLYSNANIERAAYHNLFAQLGESLPDLTYIPTMTHSENWGGETARIDSEFLKKKVTDIENKDYYLCGPPGMVNAIKEMLLQQNIPAARVRFETFWGY